MPFEANHFHFFPMPAAQVDKCFLFDEIANSFNTNDCCLCLRNSRLLLNLVWKVSGKGIKSEPMSRVLAV